MSSPVPPQRAVDRVQPQRARLRDAHAAFEQACAAPDSSLEGAKDALATLREAFAAHVSFAEGAGGLFEEMQDDAAVESANEVDRLRRDHLTISATIERVGDLLSSSGASLDDERIDDGVAELTRMIGQHRRRGAELLLNVYGVEVGGGD
jgi:hypothetical protein